VTGVTVLLAAILAGAVVTPALLPWVPGRAFAFKGMLVGLPLVGLALWWRRPFSPGAGWAFEAGGWLLAGVAVAAFLAMNFTGSSTYTSLSGVKREMRIAVPAEIAAITVGVALVVASKWLAP
jgi:acetyl-CoA decarbonylase/synthase complex subunit gamma